MTRSGLIVAVGLVVLNVLLTSASARAETIGAAHKVTVVFRYDDYSGTSPLWLEKSIFEEFARRKLSLTVGVIPFIRSDGRNISLDSAHVETLARYARSGTIEIALHGYTHRGVNQYEPTEFAGVGYARQVEMMRRGRDELVRLVGIAPRTFIPPYNSYDANTIRAAHAAGMVHVSAAFGGPTGRGLIWLPQTSEMREAREAVNKAERLVFADPFVVVVVHAFDFKEVSPTRGVTTLPEFGAFLTELAGRADVRVADIASAARGKDFSASTYEGNVRFAGRPNLLPDSLFAGSGRVYFPLDGLRRAAGRERAITVLFYICLFVAAGVMSVVGKLIVERIGQRRCWIWGGAVLIVLLVLVAVGHRPVAPRRMMLAVFGAGAYVGGLVAMRAPNRFRFLRDRGPVELTEVRK